MKNTAAMFEIVTTAQRNSIFAPSVGRVIWNIEKGVFEYYNGSQWIVFGNDGGESGPINAISQGDSTVSITDDQGGAGIVVHKVDNVVIAVGTVNGYNFNITPSAPTPSTGDNSTKIATTQFVNNAVLAGGGNGGANIAFIEAMLGGW